MAFYFDPVKLHYKSYGSGKPILILHGLFGMLANWSTFARHLSEAYHVYTIDLRNHGRSPHEETFHYQVMAGDILEFLDAHELRKVTILGHSLGGKVAMQTALTHPKSVEKLIVIDMAPRAYSSAHDAIIEALLNIDMHGMASRKEIERVLMNRLSDPGIVLFLMKNVARRKDGTLYWRMNLPVLAANYPNTTAAVELSKPFDGPVLFVRGGQSNYIPDEDWPDIKKHFPAAKLKTIEKAGHWVHADAMEELLGITREFLEEGNVKHKSHYN